MVTKGIITSIDFNGNTCQVRIPFFETAGNDQIISTAVISNTPGSYNGYKVGDVVLIAFEDGQMETPVVIGKLYLGVEKEKADPRGVLNTETLNASKTATVPADTKLTTNTDKNLPNTMNPYANLSSIANNLNKLNTDVTYLDAFTNNQFRSIITDANGMRSSIEQNAANIEAKVDKEHDGTTTGLGWNLTDTKWTIDATNTSWPTNKLTLFEVDRNGQVIINGKNVRIGGYPQSRTRFYKKLAAGSTAPSAPAENTHTEDLPDLGWHEVYKWENNYHIWETIQTIAYDIDSYGELQPKITYSTPVDITGAAGEQGIGIKSQTIYYAMVDPDIVHVEKPDYAPEGGSNPDNHVYGNSAGGNIIDLTADSPVKGYGWSTTPHEYIDNWNYYTSVLTIYSDDDQTVSPAINHRSFADPVKAQELDGVYELAQGKSKNYYSETNPAGTRGSATYGLTMQEGYCWFDTGYTQISTPDTKSDYLGKWLRIPDDNGDYAVKSGESPVRLIHWKEGITGQRYTMVKVGPDNIDTLISDNTIVIGTTEAFETGILSQWDGTDWVDVSGELVTNKLTANYINALDITAKKISIYDGNKPVFIANTIDPTSGSYDVNIGGFEVDDSTLSNGTFGSNPSVLVSTGYKSTASIGGSPAGTEKEWAFTAGNAFGVASNGDLYANNAHIKGDINVSGDLHTTGYNIGDDTGIWISAAGINSEADVGGSGSGKTRTWTIAAGDDFGVTTNGSVYANNVNITGTVKATGGLIGKLEITTNGLKYTDNNTDKLVLDPSREVSLDDRTPNGALMVSSANIYAADLGFKATPNDTAQWLKIANGYSGYAFSSVNHADGVFLPIKYPYMYGIYRLDNGTTPPARYITALDIRTVTIKAGERSADITYEYTNNDMKILSAIVVQIGSTDSLPAVSWTNTDTKQKVTLDRHSPSSEATYSVWVLAEYRACLSLAEVKAK